MREIIRTAWQGKSSLAKAFWGNFVLGQFVVAVAIIVLFSPALLFGDKAVEAVKFITWPLYYVFLVWAMVSIWKCAPNTKHHAFSVAAKVFVVLYSLLWVAAFLQERAGVS
jgi:hypothetical protein